MGAGNGINWGLLAAIYMGLLLFGIGYNALIDLAERRGWLRGYTALAVGLGVMVTLGAMALINWQFAVVTLGAFLFSGAPMLAGSIWRHVRSRERELEALRKEAMGDDTA